MKRKSYDLFVVHNLHFFCFSYLWSRLWKWRSMCWPQPVCMPLWFSRPTVSRRHWWMFHGAQCAQMFLRFHMCQQAWMVSSIQSTTIGSLILRFRYCEKTTKLEKNLPPFLKNYLVTSKQSWISFQIFVAFSEYLNFQWAKNQCALYQTKYFSWKLETLFPLENQSFMRFLIKNIHKLFYFQHKSETA